MVKELIKSYTASDCDKIFKTENSQTRSQIGEENYHNLEKVLQKYEAEVRDHIRVE